MQTLAFIVQPFVIIGNVQIRVIYSQTDFKQYTMNEWINLSTSLLYCTIYMFWSMGAQYLSISIRYFAKSYMNIKKIYIFWTPIQSIEQKILLLASNLFELLLLSLEISWYNMECFDLLNIYSKLNLVQNQAQDI